jgi:hypothetical protein
MLSWNVQHVSKGSFQSQTWDQLIPADTHYQFFFFFFKKKTHLILKRSNHVYIYIYIYSSYIIINSVLHKHKISHNKQFLNILVGALSACTPKFHRLGGKIKVMIKGHAVAETTCLCGRKCVSSDIQAMPEMSIGIFKHKKY